MKAIFSSRVNWNTFIVGYVGHFESEVRSKSKYFVKIGWCWKKFWNYSKSYRKFWEIFGISGSWLGSGSARELSSSARLEDFWLDKSSARFWLVKFWLGSARNWKFWLGPTPTMWLCRCAKVGTAAITKKVRNKKSLQYNFLSCFLFLSLTRALRLVRQGKM